MGFTLLAPTSHEDAAATAQRIYDAVGVLSILAPTEDGRYQVVFSSEHEGKVQSVLQEGN